MFNVSFAYQNPSLCHSERSEESRVHPRFCNQILRVAQNDTMVTMNDNIKSQLIIQNNF